MKLIMTAIAALLFISACGKKSDPADKETNATVQTLPEETNQTLDETIEALKEEKEITLELIDKAQESLGVLNAMENNTSFVKPEGFSQSLRELIALQKDVIAVLKETNDEALFKQELETIKKIDEANKAIAQLDAQTGIDSQAIIEKVKADFEAPVENEEIRKIDEEITKIDAQTLRIEEALDQLIEE